MYQFWLKCTYHCCFPRSLTPLVKACWSPPSQLAKRRPEGPHTRSRVPEGPLTSSSEIIPYSFFSASLMYVDGLLAPWLRSTRLPRYNSDSHTVAVPRGSSVCKHTAPNLPLLWPKDKQQQEDDPSLKDAQAAWWAARGGEDPASAAADCFAASMRLVRGKYAVGGGTGRLTPTQHQPQSSKQLFWRARLVLSTCTYQQKYKKYKHCCYVLSLNI